MNKLVLSLHNFQSISEGELVFNTGLNFIIGQSNSGKSATFRALKACLLNPAGSQRFIKKGNNKSEVTLKYNGQEIQWERTPKESNYVINGEPYYKTGRSSAFKILEDKTGFNQDTNGAIMNIEEELQLPFPFGLSSSDLFKLFENIFCISDSSIILKSAKDYEKGVEGEISTLELEEQKTEAKINALTEFREAVDLTKLLRYKEKLESASTKLEKLKDGMDLIKLAVKLDKKSGVVKEKEFSDLSLLYRSAVECKELLSQAKEFYELNKKLQELQEPEKIDLSKYDELCELKKTFTSLKKLNKLVLDEQEFESTIGKLRELKQIKDFIQSYKENLKKLEQEEEMAEGKISLLEEKLKEFKVCPLCHKPL